MLEIVQIPVLTDNYVYLVHEPQRDVTAVVDPAVANEVMAALEARRWQLDYILNTHHHGDHVGGNRELKSATGCTVVGPEADRARIPGIDRTLADGDEFALGAAVARIFDVPGHTSGHIAFYFPESDALFCGDTLFAMGCGRLFEGTPSEMYRSLAKFRDLPDRTRVYCAHEYTEANGRFALTVDPENSALIDRMRDVRAKREHDEPTVPSLLGEERATNPFLRADTDGIRDTLGMAEAPAVDVFAEVRRRKDSF